MLWSLIHFYNLFQQHPSWKKTKLPIKKSLSSPENSGAPPGDGIGRTTALQSLPYTQKQALQRGRLRPGPASHLL